MSLRRINKELRFSREINANSFTQLQHFLQKTKNHEEEENTHEQLLLDGNPPEMNFSSLPSMTEGGYYFNARKGTCLRQHDESGSELRDVQLDGENIDDHSTF